MHTVELFKDFRFDAAHYLPSAPEGHPNSRMHGHSFRVRVFLRGEPDPETGLLKHFESVDGAVTRVQQMLDHNLLNEIPGLDKPTLEYISLFIFNELKDELSALYKVGVYRDSLGEGCEYAPANERVKA